MPVNPVVRPDGTIDWTGVTTIANSGMGIYGPATVDPTTAAAVRQPNQAAAPVINPDGTLGYPYQPGVDPQYDAWLAQYNNDRTVDQSDAKLRQQQADQAYQDQLHGIGTSADTSRKNLQNNMLQRGVLRSGETAVRGADLEAGVLQQQTTANTGLATQSSTISSDLQKAIAALDTQNLGQINDAISRQTAKAVALAAAATPAPQAAAPAPAAEAAAPAAPAARAAAPVVTPPPAAVTPPVVYAPTPGAGGTTGGIASKIGATLGAAAGLGSLKPTVQKKAGTRTITRTGSY